MLIHSIQTQLLNIANWNFQPGEVWCVLGNNASGKSQLAAAICGELKSGKCQIEDPPTSPAWVSFETLQSAYEREIANDDTDFLDRIDLGSTGLELLLESGASESQARSQAEFFGISHLLDRGCRSFSSGELRRIQILATILSEPGLLILDEPFDALDSKSRQASDRFFGQLSASGQPMLLLVNRRDDISEWTTHLALLANGSCIARGPREEILASPACEQLLAFGQRALPELPAPPDDDQLHSDPLLAFHSVGVRYGDAVQFQGFDWTLRPGEHTLVHGPNGCGKSTLLGLITGDHPQCYANDIQIFGYQRGTGESIWDIKRQLGIVSPSLHRDYRARGNIETVAFSGFFDSIGLYAQPTTQQRQTANQWLEVLGLIDFAKRPFSTLSFGQQRLALIARALVKQPPLIILDEPTQGLDDLNRHLVLASLESLASLQRTTLIFVSHREDEHLSLFKQRLQFSEDTSGNARYNILKLP